MATGSDIGGSIRIPASFSGVVGFKPPFGRVPGLAPYHLDQYCHDGPMARTVADCGLLENVLAGPHWRDIVSLRDPPQIPREATGVDGMRIALCMTLGDWQVDADVVANTHRVAEALRQAGAHVDEVVLPWTTERIWQAARAHFGTIFGPGIGAIGVEYGDLLNDYTRAFVSEMKTELTFYEGLVEETALWDPLGRLFEDVDVVLCPTDRHHRSARRRVVHRRTGRDQRSLCHAPHHGDDDVAVQPVQSVPGHLGAIRAGGKRRADRGADRRADV